MTNHNIYFSYDNEVLLMILVSSNLLRLDVIEKETNELFNKKARRKLSEIADERVKQM